MPLWAAVLLILLFTAASALCFKRVCGSRKRSFLALIFTLIGIAFFLYSAATLLFVTSVD
ncbi:MAG: hypothetical protein GX791_06340 [Synergistaceae bacterium]|nr:hypothetical protein [Synergistaceae bacterium]